MNLKAKNEFTNFQFKYSILKHKKRIKKIKDTVESDQANVI